MWCLRAAPNGIGHWWIAGRGTAAGGGDGDAGGDTGEVDCVDGAVAEETIAGAVGAGFAARVSGSAEVEPPHALASETRPASTPSAIRELRGAPMRTLCQREPRR